MARVLRGLDAEWRHLARSPRARRALMRWRRTHPVFEAMRDLDDVLTRRAGDPDAAQEVLAALAALAPSDELAARVLLQAMVPALVRLSLTVGHGDWSALDDMVALAWERIRTYPASREGSVAANIRWDVRKWYRWHRDIEQPRKDHHRAQVAGRPVPADDDVVLERHVTAPPAEEEALQRVFLDDLVDAQRQGVISAPALRLIVRTRILGESVSEVAARHGINRNTLMAQRFRAERRLRTGALAC